MYWPFGSTRADSPTWKALLNTVKQIRFSYLRRQPVLLGITDGDATTAQWFNNTFGTQITVVPVDGASGEAYKELLASQVETRKEIWGSEK